MYLQNLLRVVVAFGDSVAAGVGCPDNERAMAGSFGRACAAATGGDVVWHSVGRTGTTARTMCHPKQLARLRAIVDTGNEVDAIMVSVGVNHVLSGHAPAQFAFELEAMLRELRKIVGRRTAILLNGLPPMSRFPNIPFPLSVFAGAYVRTLSGTACEVCERTGLATFVDCEFFEALLPQASMKERLPYFAPDKFHPSVRAMDEFWTPMNARLALEVLEGRRPPSKEV